MASDTNSPIGLLRTRPDVRRDFLLGFGVLALGFCFHSWLDSSLIARMAESMGPIQAATLGGALAGATTLATGVVLGWIGGGMLLQSGRSLQSANRYMETERPSVLSSIQDWFESYPASRGLLLGGITMVVGTSLGLWVLLGGVIMVVGIALGYWGRAAAPRVDF